MKKNNLNSRAMTIGPGFKNAWATEKVFPGDTPIVNPRGGYE
jgi:hypothetical protein